MTKQYTKKSSGTSSKNIPPKKQPKPKTTSPKPQAKGGTKPPRKGSGAKQTSPLRVISLGGLGEIGKNMTALEWENDILLIDSGVAFPDEELMGIDLVIPDITYLVDNYEKLRGLVITHGHEDHIGAIPYVLQQLNIPIYTTRLTSAIIRNKLGEFRLPEKPQIHVVEAGDTVKLGVFRVEFIHVNHSIPDACALAITTPVGLVFHTGDFKLDTSPVDGKIMDIARIGALGNQGIALLLGESTNAERAGYTPSESTVGTTFETIFSHNKDKRLVIATFSSNVHRVQQIVDAALRHKRKVAFLGRSMIHIVGAAIEMGYMHIPAEAMVDIADIRRYKPSQICLITTGSQGEPMSALYRMAFGENPQVKLSSTSDLVILSSHPIPGNEKLVGKIINALTKNGVQVYHTGALDVHVSGHACQEELKLMLALTKPRYFMPIHGEARHLAAHAALAEKMGIPKNHIFISDIGKVLELDPNGCRLAGSVPSGQVFVDGSGVGDVGAVVLRERRHLGEAGMIAITCAVDLKERLLLSPPELTAKGFAFLNQTEGMMEEAEGIAMRVFDRHLKRSRPDLAQIKNALREELQKFFYRKTKRSPVILPLIIEL